LTKIQLRASDLYLGVINCKLTNKCCFLGTTNILFNCHRSALDYAALGSNPTGKTSSLQLRNAAHQNRGKVIRSSVHSAKPVSFIGK